MELSSELSIVSFKWGFTIESHMHPTSVADLNRSAIILGLFLCFLLVQERKVFLQLRRLAVKELLCFLI